MWNIGSLSLENRVIFAPLAGITNLPLRILAKEAGCGLVCSEMISANGLLHGSEKTFKLLDSSEEEKPLSVQIFGSSPEMMAEAAVICRDLGADILDINFGCSVKKVLKTGAGSALMKEPRLAEKLLKAVRKAIDIPLTIKIRTGWDFSGKDAVIISKIAESCGADAICVHPRTATQGFRGRADRNVIKMVKNSVSIPVIGNGDITSAGHAISMVRETGCDAVMVGRAAIGDPWIFSRILAAQKGETRPMPDLKMRREAMIRFLDRSIEYFGQTRACYMMRSRLAWFVKGLPRAKHFREYIKHVKSGDEAAEIIKQYFGSLKLDHKKKTDSIDQK